MYTYNISIEWKKKKTFKYLIVKISEKKIFKKTRGKNLFQSHQTKCTNILIFVFVIYFWIKRKNIFFFFGWKENYIRDIASWSSSWNWENKYKTDDEWRTKKEIKDKRKKGTNTLLCAHFRKIKFVKHLPFTQTSF